MLLRWCKCCTILPRLCLCLQTLFSFFSPSFRFANRETRDFITPDQVEMLEEWSGKAVCQALIDVHIPIDVSVLSLV